MPEEEHACARRSFAEAMFERAKREAARMDSGGWNSGSVISARGPQVCFNSLDNPLLFPSCRVSMRQHRISGE